MLPRHLPKTGIKVIQKLTPKIAGNITANQYDGEYIGANQTTEANNESVIWEGLALIDDGIREYNKETGQYGYNHGGGYTIYIDLRNCKAGQITKELLPELYVKYSDIHGKKLFDNTKPFTELKIIDVDTPNGIRLKHIQLTSITSS